MSLESRNVQTQNCALILCTVWPRNAPEKKTAQTLKRLPKTVRVCYYTGIYLKVTFLRKMRKSCSMRKFSVISGNFGLYPDRSIFLNLLFVSAEFWIISYTVSENYKQVPFDMSGKTTLVLLVKLLTPSFICINKWIRNTVNSILVGLNCPFKC